MREWYLVQLILTFSEVQLEKSFPVLVVLYPHFDFDLTDVDIKGRFLEVGHAFAGRHACEASTCPILHASYPADASVGAWWLND